VSHNTWDYKNALGRPLNDNIESLEVSHFEAKYQTFQTRGVRFWCVDFFVINFSKKPTTQNLEDFIYVVILPNFWQALAQTTDHLQKWPTHLWRALFILYTPDILSFRLNVLKIKFIDIAFHIFFLQAVFFKLTLRFDGFFTMNPMCYGTPCISYPISRPKKWYNILSYITAKKWKRIYILYPFQFYFSIKNMKWDVQLWGFGSLFWNSLMHCLAERPKKIKIIYFWTTFDSFVIFTCIARCR
jgi:hypothetical protein